jgi:hypothetical protein
MKKNCLILLLSPIMFLLFAALMLGCKKNDAEKPAISSNFNTEKFFMGEQV